VKGYSDNGCLFNINPFQDKATLIKIGENFLMYICIRKLRRDLVKIVHEEGLPIIYEEMHEYLVIYDGKLVIYDLTPNPFQHFQFF
jgi:hypothetical protein